MDMHISRWRLHPFYFVILNEVKNLKNWTRYKAEHLRFFATLRMTGRSISPLPG